MTDGEFIGERTCDVLILGAGMAGGMLARHLRLQQPDLKIVVIERKAAFDYWVGESTVEVFTDYAERVLGLGPYLMTHQILKHGLRFFFDSPGADLRMCELSETGRARYPGVIPSYQLDRSTFDRDLCEINRASGVEVLMGVRLSAEEEEPRSQPITIDPAGGHVVRTTAGTFRCRWLVDAAGRGSPLAKMFHLVEKDPRHPVGSYWGRFQHCRNMDELGTDEWRARVDFTQRWLSTNHFMYKGYWIWHIPVRHDIISLGVSFNREMLPLTLRSGEELLTWLRGHKWGAEILGPETKVLDFMQFKECARGATKHFSEDRWYLTGMSGCVVDALFSQTGVFNSYSNRLINELIKTDRSGDRARLRRQLTHFNVFMRMKYEALVAALKYHRLGSYDAFIGWRTARQHVYYNTDIPIGHTDLRDLIEAADAHGDACGCTFERALADWQKKSIGAALDRVADEFIAFVERTGSYYARNKDHFCEATERFRLAGKVHQPRRDLAVERAEDRVSFEAMFRHFVGRMLEIEGKRFNEEAFSRVFEPDWELGQTLTDVMIVMRDASSLAEADGGAPRGVRWLPKGPVDEITLRDHGWYCRLTRPADAE
jgi:flavin-dependent dehydrogenase